jgi:hypothetical protein
MSSLPFLSHRLFVAALKSTPPGLTNGARTDRAMEVAAAVISASKEPADGATRRAQSQRVEKLYPPSADAEDGLPSWFARWRLEVNRGNSKS